MAYNSLLLVTLKAFVVLISAQAALGTPVGGLLIDGAEVRASHGRNPQILNVNPLDKLTSVSEVVNLISLNRYESWCIGFLGAPAGAGIVKACFTITVNNIKTVRSGTSTVISTIFEVGVSNPVYRIATITKTRTATSTTTTTTTRTTTPIFAPPPPAVRRRESDTAIPDFLNGCGEAIISSACSTLLHSLPQDTTATSTTCSRTETAYAATTTIPRKTTTTTTTTTLIVPTIPATTTVTTTTTTTSTTSIIFTACPNSTHLPSLYAIGYDQGEFKDLPATSVEDCCLACYDSSRSVNCNAWLWWGEGDRCTVTIGTSPNEDASPICPKGFGDAVFGQDENPVNIGVGGSGPCGRNISVF